MPGNGSQLRPLARQPRLRPRLPVVLQPGRAVTQSLGLSSPMSGTARLRVYREQSRCSGLTER